MRGAAAGALAVALLAPGARDAGAQRVDTVHAHMMDFADGLLCAGSPAPDRAAGPAPRRSTDSVVYMTGPFIHEAIDTTIVLATDRGDWQRASYVGGVAISTDDLPFTTSRFTTCAGVSVFLRRATVALRGVRGTVHLRGDFGALERVAGRMPRGTAAPSRPDRSPPAVPPGR